MLLRSVRILGVEHRQAKHVSERIGRRSCRFSGSTSSLKGRNTGAVVFNAVSISTAASHAPGAISTGATCAVDAPSDSAASSHWKPSPSRSQRRRTTPTALAGILVAMLALHVRLSAAFVATGSRVLTSHISSVAGSYLPRGGSAAMHSRLYGSITRGRMERLPWDVGAGKLTTKLLPRRSSALMSTASHSALSGKEEEGEDSSMAEGARNDTQRLSPEQRAAVKAERRRRREKARQARILHVGRAKSVRRDGSSTENKGLEALLPPEGAPGSGAPALSGLPDVDEDFTVLGIETSCDDTAAAVVRSDGTVLGEAIAGQAAVHEEWGGVVPGLARDCHAAKMDGVVKKALQEAGMASAAEVDAIGVTVGPGLEICLRVGCEKAKALAVEHKKPFVSVHHLEAHALLARKCFPPAKDNAATPAAADSDGISSHSDYDAAGNTRSDADGETSLEFPFLGLLVSGGHCQLLLCEGVGSYTVIGGTIDDALGEAYDKAARLLGLKVGGGGGPAVEALALGGDPKAVPLAVPMQARKDCDFSFAGLKNSFRLAVVRAVDDFEQQQQQQEHEQEVRTAVESGVPAGGGSIAEGDEAHMREKDVASAANMESRGAALPESTRADLAASFQSTAIRHLEERVRRAMDICEKTHPSSASPLAQIEDEANDESEGHSLRDHNGDVNGSAGGVRALAVVGGVAANKELRRRLQALCDEREPGWRMAVPPARLCTDNGVMVAWAAVERLRKGMSNRAEGQEVYARLPLGRAAAGADAASSGGGHSSTDRAWGTLGEKNSQAVEEGLTPNTAMSSA